GIPVEHGMSLSIVFTPAQRIGHQHFLSRLRLRERVAADPVFAVQGVAIPVGEDLVLALVGQSRLQKWRWRKLGYIGFGRSDIDEPAVVLDLVIGSWIEQIF